jgi:hypothetical protein
LSIFGFEIWCRRVGRTLHHCAGGFGGGFSLYIGHLEQRFVVDLRRYRARTSRELRKSGSPQISKCAEILVANVCRSGSGMEQLEVVATINKW